MSDIVFMSKVVNLDYKVLHIDYNNAKWDAMKKKYGNGARIADPGYLGSVLISSESDEFSVRDLVEEFEIELLDDYFERSLAHRQVPGHMEP